MDNDTLRKKIQISIKQKKLSVAYIERLSDMGNGVLRNFLSGKTKNLNTSNLNSVLAILEIEYFLDTKKIDYSLKWKKNLFKEILDFVDDFINISKSEVDLKKILEFSEEIYSFCISKNEEKLDKKFSEWYLNNKLSTN